MSRPKSKPSTSKKSSKFVDKDEELMNIVNSSKDFKKCLDKWIEDEANKEQIRILHDCGAETKEFTTPRESFHELIKGLELKTKIPKNKELENMFHDLDDDDDYSDDIDIKHELEQLRSFPQKVLSGQKSASTKKEAKDYLMGNYLPSTFKGFSQDDFKLSFEQYNEGVRKELSESLLDAKRTG